MAWAFTYVSLVKISHVSEPRQSECFNNKKYRKTNIIFIFKCGMLNPQIFYFFQRPSTCFIRDDLKNNYTNLQENFGANLKRIRELKEFSLRSLAANCELDDSQISKIENGRTNIQLSTIFELAKGLGVEPKELLDFKI